MFFFTKDVEKNPGWLSTVTFIILSSNFIFVVYWFIHLYDALRNEINCVQRCDLRCRYSYQKLKSYIKFQIHQSSCCQRWCCWCYSWMSRHRAKKRRRAAAGGGSVVQDVDFDEDDSTGEHDNIQRRSHSDSIWDLPTTTGSSSSKQKRRSKTQKNKKNSKKALELAPIPLARQFKERQRMLAKSAAKADRELELRQQRALHLAKDGTLHNNRYVVSSMICFCCLYHSNIYRYVNLTYMNFFDLNSFFYSFFLVLMKHLQLDYN